MATNYTATNIGTGVAQQSTMNAEWAAIQAALERVLNVYGDSTNGTNQLQVDIDMNSNQLLNLVDPTLAQHAATKAYVDAVVTSGLPDQSGHAGQYLQTNGTVADWATVDALPDQSGHAGQYLQTNGTVADWAAVVSSPWTEVANQLYYDGGAGTDFGLGSSAIAAFTSVATGVMIGDNSCLTGRSEGTSTGWLDLMHNMYFNGANHEYIHAGTAAKIQIAGWDSSRIRFYVAASGAAAGNASSTWIQTLMLESHSNGGTAIFNSGYTSDTVAQVQVGVSSTGIGRDTANGYLRLFGSGIAANTSIYGTNAAGPAFMNEAATDLNPTLVPNKTDLDTGIGWASADILTLVAGGVEQLRVTEVAGLGQVIIPQQNSATSPSLAFGDGDTGFFESIDDTVRYTRAGVNMFVIDSNGINANASSGFRLVNETASATNPTLIPNSAAGSTGIGSNASTQISLISGGVEKIRINSSGLVAPVTDGPAVLTEGATNTNPTLIPNSDDFTTGIGGNLTATDISLIVGGVENARVDDDATAGNTRFMIYDVDNATLERVTVGAADSGGTGYKVLRILN